MTNNSTLWYTPKRTSCTFTIGNMCKDVHRRFPGGLTGKNLPSSAGDAGSLPGQGTKIQHAVGQLSSHAATREACTRQRTPSTAKKNGKKRMFTGELTAQ